jgi:transcriptional regulator GlxA family with amidase domain
MIGKTLSRRILVLAYPQVDLLDLAGPIEVFHVANLVSSVPEGKPLNPHLLARRSAEDDPYRIETVSSQGKGPVKTGSGVCILPNLKLDEVKGGVHTLIVPGGEPDEAMADENLKRWLRKKSKTLPRLVSVCSGALILAAAGLLDGRRATTHWLSEDFMKTEFPKVRVEIDPIYIRDGNILTSAGSTAGMDLALALVEEDLGRAMAIKVAQFMIMFMRRQGGQSQFSAILKGQAAEKRSIRDLLTRIPQTLAEDLSVERLARLSNMSVRNFSRVFLREVGVTPACFVENARLEGARRLLEESEKSLDQIAEDCGLGSADSLRRVFRRRFGTSAKEYRDHFKVGVDDLEKQRSFSGKGRSEAGFLQLQSFENG